MELIEDEIIEIVEPELAFSGDSLKNGLELVIQEKSLGKLVTNAQVLRSFVSEALKEYTPEKYSGDVKQAAKDKAQLNAAGKKLNDQRIALECEWNSPFQDFKEIITETVGMIKTASGKLDEIVKAKEAKEKEEKKQSISKLWAAKNFDLVPLEKVFNPKWLNKGFKITQIDLEIDGIITQIKGDIDSLEVFGEDAQTLKALYLSTLDLQAALNKGAELKKNREKLAEMKAAEEEQEENQTETEDEINICEVIENYSSGEESESESESESEAEDENENENNERKYIFHVYGNKSSIEIVESIAFSEGIELIPSFTFSATEREINVFKSRLAQNGLLYKKAKLPNLHIEKA